MLNRTKTWGTLSLMSSQMKFLEVLTGPYATAIILSLTPFVMAVIEWESRVSRWSKLMAGGGTSDGSLNTWGPPTFDS